MYQICGHLSVGLWTELRRRHLLHPEGIPLFNPDWSLRPTQPLSDGAMARIPEDWLVVVAQRPGNKRRVLGIQEIYHRTLAMFPPGRVVVFRGSLSILEGMPAPTPRPPSLHSHRGLPAGPLSRLGSSHSHATGSQTPDLGARAGTCLTVCHELVATWRYVGRALCSQCGLGACLGGVMHPPKVLFSALLEENNAPSVHAPAGHAPRSTRAYAARAVFRRARLFVAGHGAAMANMIFMPTGASVVEMRPDEFPNPCYHSLADACSLRYHLIFGRGTGEGSVAVDVEEVMKLVEDISQGF